MQNVTQHEYLTAARASLICILLTLSLHLSVFCLSCLYLSIHHQISGISPGRCSSIKGRENGCSRFLPPPRSSSVLSPVEPSHSLVNIVDKKYLPSWTWSHLVSFNPIARTKRSWSRAHLRTDCLIPPSTIMTFELPCWSWDFALLSSPPGAAGNWLLWPSGLYSHGEAHYCSHMAGYKDDETMWALFSNKFLLPPEAQSSFTGHISEMP